MVFASPMWLLGLLPWVAVVIYLLPGRGTPAMVPFLGLWRENAVVSKRPARRWPGVAVLFALLALLLAILGAAKPSRLVRDAKYFDVSIILDRGASMALPSASGKPFRNVISRLESVAGNVTLVPVPGQVIQTTGDAWQAVAKAMSPTAITVKLDAAVAEQLRKTRGPVFVLSDQRLILKDPRIVQIEPEPASDTVAITAVGAKLLPHPQVMVRLENRSDLPAIPIVIQSDDMTVRREVALPHRGQSADQFFDLAKLGPIVRARLDLNQPENPWSTAQLVRKSSGIHIAVDSSVDESVRRISEIYARNRPAGADAKQVIVSDHPLEGDQIGIWIGVAGDTENVGGVTVVPHAVTRNVKSWPMAGAPATPAGFLPVVTIGGNAIAAVRDGSARQVWISGELRDWSKTSDFVVFFANAFDWIAGKDQSYTSISPALLGDDWHVVESDVKTRPGEWPGVYQSAAGRLVAVNAGGVPKLLAVEIPAVSSAKSDSLPQNISMSRVVIFAALGCLLIASILWTGSARSTSR